MKLTIRKYSYFVLVVILGFAFVVSYMFAPVARVQKAGAASADYFLKIEGIDGEATDSLHKGEIEINSWSWGESRPSTLSGGSGGGAGKVSMQDFHFTMSVNKASPQLMLAVATGTHYKKAILVARKAGGDKQEYYKIQLSDVLVTSYAVAGGGSNQVPQEEFSLNFTKIEFEYKPQTTDGSASTPIKAGWDVKANIKV